MKRGYFSLMKRLKEGFLSGARAVKHNKKLFLVLIIVQILFIVSLAYIGIDYQVKLYKNVQGIIGPLQSLGDYDVTALNAGNTGIEGPVLEEMMGKIVSVTQNYQEMIHNILKLSGWLLGLFLVLNGFIWSLVNYMLRKGNLLKYWGKFILVSLVFLVPAGLVSYLVLKNLIGKDISLFIWGVEGASALFLIVSYFMIIGWSLLDRRFGEVFKEIFIIGFKKIHWMLLSLVLCFGLLVLSLLLADILIGNLFLMLLSGLLVVLIFVFGKLFLAGMVKGLKENLEKKKV